MLDQLLKDYQTLEQILGENGILKQLTKRLAERALQAEMTHHLGYAKHDYQGKDDKETFDDFNNHNADDDLLENELPSTEEENIQPSTISDEATILAGKPVRKKSNTRNGTTKKTVLTDFGHIELDVPRDRECSFDPERGNSKVSLRPSARRRLCLSNC